MNASPYLLIISVIILSIAKADQVPEFSVEGELSNQYFEKGVLVGSGVNRFTVSVVGCQSLIRIDRKGKGGIQYDEFGCPGTNSFTVRVYGPLAMGDATVKLFNPKTGQLEEVGDALNKKVSNDATLVIHSEVIPDYTKEFVTPIWLAYASFCFFPASDGDEYLLPIYPLGEDPAARDLFAAERKEARTRWKRDDRLPRLLSEVDVLRDRKMYFAVGGKLRQMRAPPSLKVHESVYSYKVDVWTNVAGLNLPLRFTVTRKNLLAVPSTDPAGEEHLSKLIYVGTLKSAAAKAMANTFVPEIPKASRVIENRFAVERPSVRNVDYLISDGRILSLSEVRRLEKFQIMQRESGFREGATPKKWMITATLGVLLILPLVLYVRNLLGKRG